MKKKISLVSYYNALPYRYGLESNKEAMRLFDIDYDTPAECSKKISRGEAVIGLVPVASVFQLIDRVKWQSNYGIASDGKVESVLLLSNKDISECSRIYQDTESATSVRLLRILTREYWKINPAYYDFNQTIDDQNEFRLLIGDKALQQRSSFRHAYDLSEIWKEHTGLPFVFARWISTEKLLEEEIKVLDDSFNQGMNLRTQIAGEVKLDGIDENYYLNTCIRYILGGMEEKGLELFYSKLRALDISAV